MCFPKNCSITKVRQSVFEHNAFQKTCQVITLINIWLINSQSHDIFPTLPVARQFRLVRVTRTVDDYKARRNSRTRLSLDRQRKRGILSRKKNASG